MITCYVCGDTNGPWCHEKKIGFICNDCWEKALKLTTTTRHKIIIEHLKEMERRPYVQKKSSKT